MGAGAIPEGHAKGRVPSGTRPDRGVSPLGSNGLSAPEAHPSAPQESPSPHRPSCAPIPSEKSSLRRPNEPALLPIIPCGMRRAYRGRLTRTLPNGSILGVLKK